MTTQNKQVLRISSQVAAARPEMGRTSAVGAGTQALRIAAITPDYTQPRWYLPTSLRAGLIAGKLTPEQAIQRWQELAEAGTLNARWNVLVRLARSIAADSQAEPALVVKDGDGYRLIAGELRYWAHWVGVVVLKNPSLQLMPCLVKAEASKRLQAAENLLRTDLNGVAMARQIALLLVDGGSLHEYPGPHALTTWGDYRKAAETRVKPGGWEAVTAFIEESPNYLQKYLRLLTLPPKALEVADEADLSERQLRPIVALDDAKRQTKLIELVATYGLEPARVAALVRHVDLARAEQELKAERGGEKAKPGSKKTRGQHDAAQVLRQRAGQLLLFAQRVRKSDRDPAEVLAGQLTNEGAGAIDELSELVKILQAAIKLARASGSSKK